MERSKALVVHNLDDGTITRVIETRNLTEPREDWVRVRIKYSALNYKDALAATGNPGVALKFPLVPGIDAVGEVVDAISSRFAEGEYVMVAHPDFGTRTDGGYSQFVDVPESWLLKLPDGLTPLECITLGTAGFTAAQCVKALVDSGLQPADGDVIVTGATGGVGIFAVMLLKLLGYQVVAATGKPERHEDLKRLGASRFVSREEVVDDSPRPLLSAKWAGAVDTGGGATLATIIRSTKPHRIVTACGLVGGHELKLTVYPFILRGVSLVGIDSALVSSADRIEIWRRLANEWRLRNLTELAAIVPLEGLEQSISEILQGKIFGRVVVRLD